MTVRELKEFKGQEIKVLLLEGLNQTGINILKGAGYKVESHPKALDVQVLKEKIKDVHAIGIRSKTKLTAEILKEAKNLLAIGCFCIGTNQVDLEYAASRGIAVFNSPFSNSRSVAEMVIAEMIALSRQLCDRNTEMHAGEWKKVGTDFREIRGKILGIIGYGHIGSQLSVLADSMGMSVIFYDVLQTMPLGTARAVSTLQELLNTADFVTLHVPETPETKNMIGKKELFSMKKGSYLINASRGTVVDIPMLREALSSGHLAGAAVDVFPVEPFSNGKNFESELLGATNTILTPHIGGSTEEAQSSIGIEVGNALVRYINTGSTLGSVNFPETDIRSTFSTKNIIRVVNIHQNVPGVLKQINRVLSDFNIEKQNCDSKEQVAYFIADIMIEKDEDLHTIHDSLSAMAENILTRRNFLKNPDSKLYVQCRFNNEILTTDPVENTKEPIFDTELAWDVQPKVLSYLRSQRASLKLVCYSIIENEREPLGYVMLDLRAATQGVPPYPEKWYPLINTLNTTAFRPEIKMSFVVTNPRDKLMIMKMKEKKVEKNVIEQENIVKFDTEKVTKISASKAKEKKEQSNSKVAVKENTEKTIVETVAEAPTPGLGLVMTEKTEKISIIQKDGYYKIGQDSSFFFVWWITISFAENLDLLNVEPNNLGYFFQFNVFEHQVNTEKFFHLHEPNFSAERVSIRFNSDPLQLQKLFDEMEFLEIHLCNGNQVVGACKIPLKFKVGPEMCVVEQVYHLIDMPGKKPSIGVSMALSMEKKNDSKPTLVNVASPNHKQVQSLWNQFRFSIELRSIMDCQIKSAHVYFKYLYTPFGSNSPYITHPATNISRIQKEVLLPHSFCAFEFVMEPTRLSSYLHGVPLIIEMWHKDENTRDVLLGNASVDLSLVLNSPKTNAQTEVLIQSLDTIAAVMAVGQAAEKYSKVLDLRIVLALEDFGVVEEYHQEPLNIHPAPYPENSILYEQPIVSPPRVARANYAPSLAETSIHETQEYKVAMELELWRQEEQIKFRQSLAEKEKLLNAQLAKEWKQRELEREKVLKRKLADYKSLEEQLETLSLQLEKREKAILEAELVLEKRKATLEQETTRAINEAHDMMTRIKEEFKYKLELEQGRLAEADSQKCKAIKERDYIQEQYKQLDLEYSNFKRQGQMSNESGLQLELAKAIAHNTTLTQELDSTKQKLKATKQKLSKVYKGYTELRNKDLIMKERASIDQYKASIFAKSDYKEQIENFKQEINENFDPNRIEQLKRLQKEKESLLASKMYTRESDLILDLDKAIARLS